MSRLFLRAAALLALLQGVGHSAAVIRWTPSRGAEESLVTAAMQTHRFLFQGFSRSYWDFFFGYGLFAAFTCLVEAVLFWQLASVERRAAASIVLLFAVANVVYAALCWRYFFLTPFVFDAAIAACLALALLI